MRWLKETKQLQVTPAKRPKKLTATRFATVLGLNPWSTPFEVWCALTRTYEKPFEETKYTAAGKAIEPIQIEYMRNTYLMRNLVTPVDRYGEDYFKKMYGDFFHEVGVFGGMWDSLLVGKDDMAEAVLEFKTTKRSEDWADDIPEYYALQAAMYAYLLGVDDVIMVCSFLEESDYDHPEKFVPSVQNTITRSFKLTERYPDMIEKLEACQDWWNAHVVTGISPPYDEKKDAEILKALRTSTANAEEDGVDALLAEAEALKTELNAAEEALAEKNKRYKAVTEALKHHMCGKFQDGCTKVVLKGSNYLFSLNRSESRTVDKEALAEDGLLEKYTKPNETYRFTVESL